MVLLLVPVGSAWNRIAWRGEAGIFWRPDIARFERLDLDQADNSLARGRGRERIGDFRGAGSAWRPSWSPRSEISSAARAGRPGTAGMAEFRRFCSADRPLLEGRCWKPWARRAEKLGLAACVVSFAGCRASMTRPRARPRSRPPRRTPLCPHWRALARYHGRAPEWRDLDRRSGPGSGPRSSPLDRARADRMAPKGQPQHRVGVGHPRGANPHARYRVGVKA